MSTLEIPETSSVETCRDLKRFDPKSCLSSNLPLFPYNREWSFHFTWWSWCLKYLLNSFQLSFTSLHGQISVHQWRYGDRLILSPMELFTFSFVKTGCFLAKNGPFRKGFFDKFYQHRDRGHVVFFSFSLCLSLSLPLYLSMEPISPSPYFSVSINNAINRSIIYNPSLCPFNHHLLTNLLCIYHCIMF